MLLSNSTRFLRVVGLALEHHEGAREFLDHLRLARLQLLLPAAQFLEFALLFLDHFLLALEREELFLRLLHLVVEMFAREGFVFGKIEDGSSERVRSAMVCVGERERSGCDLKFQIFHAPNGEKERKEHHAEAQDQRQQVGQRRRESPTEIWPRAPGPAAPPAATKTVM